MRTIKCATNMKEQLKALEMADYILDILRGTKKPVVEETEPNMFTIHVTERQRQFGTWGGFGYRAIMATDNNVGLQFRVTGFKFHGLIRIWYNQGLDLFDIEFLRPIRKTLVKEMKEISIEDLHRILHHAIERDDDIDL